MGSSLNQTVHIIQTNTAQRSVKNLGHILILNLSYPPHTGAGFLRLSLFPLPLGGFATVAAAATTRTSAYSSLQTNTECLKMEEGTRKLQLQRLGGSPFLKRQLLKGQISAPSSSGP